MRVSNHAIVSPSTVFISSGEKKESMPIGAPTGLPARS